MSRKFSLKISFIFLFMLLSFSGVWAASLKTEAFVNRLYENFLGREGDSEGIAYWSNLLENNLSAADVAKEFFKSPEFQNSDTSDREFVRKLYKTFLDREPDKDGWDYWTKMLEEKRVKREQIFYSFVFSREFTLTSLEYKITPYDKEDKLYSFIERFYNLILDRTPAPTEVYYWYDNIMEGKMTPKEVAGGFLYSKEFLDKNLDNESFVRVLYQAVMNRAAEEEGLRFWVGKLNDGEYSRQKVIEFFLDSEEFRKLSESYLHFDDLLKADNLSLRVSSFSLKDKDGEVFEFAGGSIPLFANEDQYIFIDLCTKKIHRFKHYYHDGGILLGLVETDENGVKKVIPIDPAFPKNAISSFTKKLFSKEKIKVAIIGDSLFRPYTGEGNRWLDRVFNKNNEDKSFLIPFEDLELKNFSVGGETPMWGLAQLGLDVNTSGYVEEGEVSSVRVAGEYDPVLRDDYDLYIIGLGTNNGAYGTTEFTYNREFYEAMIRKLIRAGKDVMIVTASNNKNIIDYHSDTVDWQIEIARRYGCALANSWDYTYEAAKEGKDIWISDTIHMNDEGQKLYANAVRSVIFPYNTEIRPKGYEKIYLSEDFPLNAELIFKTPLLEGARYVEYNLTSGAEDLYPPKRHGYDKVCEIREGESATFVHPFAKGAFLLVQSREAFKAKISDENGKLVREIELREDQTSFHTIPILVSLDMRESYGQHAWRVEVESGVLRVYALGVLTKELDDIGFDTLKKIGEGWSEDEDLSAIYDFSKLLYSDTIGDELEISYNGSALNLLLGEGDSGGIIEIYEDDKLISTMDLYRYLYDSYYYEDNKIASLLIGDLSRKPSFHKVRVKLIGKSEYASSPSGNFHKLSIYGISAIGD